MKPEPTKPSAAEQLTPGPNFLYPEDLVAAEKKYRGKILRLTDFSTHYDQATKPYIYSQLAIPPLSESHHEIWTCGRGDKVTFERHGDVEIASTSTKSIIRLVVPEPDANREGRTPLSWAGYKIYRELFATIKKHRLGQLIRIWNYVPNILVMSEAKVPSEDRERYRQFNIGRYDGWQDFGPRDAEGNLLRPAATGIGTHNGPLVLEAVTSHDPVVYIENPRQIPAYHYPRRYGSKAPAFARATLNLAKTGSELFVSGTASIVGAETVHLGDPIAQVEETFTNIKTLIGRENLARYDHDGFELSELTGVRTYVKNPADYPVIKREVEKFLGPNIPVTYLNNDICRPNLLLEIEGLARKSK